MGIFVYMGIRIKVATTSEELNDVYRLRYQVYVNSGGHFEPNAQHIVMDMFDAIPDCCNIIAYDGETPIGTLRANRDSALQLPADKMFDFSQYRHKAKLQSDIDNSPEPVFVSAGMLAIEEKWRNRRDVFRALFKLACDVGYSWGATHLIVTVGIETESIYRRLGFDVLADKFWYETVGDYIVPMACELDTMYSWAFGSLNEKSGLLDAFAGCFQYLLVSAGAVIFNEGEPGNEAYLVSSGAVTISRSTLDRSESLDLATLPSGAIFGELSLIDDEPRSASAIALNNCELVVLSREAFWQKAREDADYLKSLLTILSQRLRDVDQRAFVYAHSTTEERLQFFLDKVRATAVPSNKEPQRSVAKMSVEHFAFMASAEIDETKLFLQDLQSQKQLDFTDKTIIFYYANTDIDNSNR